MTGSGASSDWDAQTYDRVADPQTRWGAQVLERLVLGGEETVLDAGCGSGRVTEQLLERLPRGRVLAVDASPAMLARARERLGSTSRVRFLATDLLDLGPDLLADDAPVDGVFSTATFHWVLDHDRLFANLAGILRSGGQLVAQCGAHGNIERLLRAARAAGAERVGSWLYATPEETAARLQRAGFTDIQVWTHDEPTRIDEQSTLLDFLETACLREYVGKLPPGQRRPFVERVARQMEEPVIDYVRLNIVARR
jgi:trans-aconitate 2-methyltransferase